LGAITALTAVADTAAAEDATAGDLDRSLFFKFFFFPGVRDADEDTPVVVLYSATFVSL
jgi:hypothetical protein